MDFLKKNWRYVFAVVVIFWIGFGYFSGSGVPFEAFQKTQKSQYGWIDQDAYFSFTQSYSYFILVILCLPVVIRFFTLDEKTKNNLALVLSIVALIALTTKPLVYGFFLRWNAGNSEGAVKRTSCSVLLKYTYSNEVAFVDCSPFEVGRQTVNADLFTALHEGDRVDLEVRSGKWQDWVSSTVKTASAL